MEATYQVTDKSILHFLTFTVVNWIDAFTKDVWRNIFYESAAFCIENKGLQIYAYCIMTNRILLVVSTNKNPISDIVRDLKAFTSRQVRLSIEEGIDDDRKKWMMNTFTFRGTYNPNNYEFQFWEAGYEPVLLHSVSTIATCVKEIHQKPVEQGLVAQAEHWLHSSAAFYKNKQVDSYLPLIRLTR